MAKKEKEDHIRADRNEDLITGEPGSHPIGAGIGAAAGGATAGAVAGAVAGPLGVVVGAVAGGVTGAFAGKAFAEQFDPTVEEAYWRGEFKNRDYYDAEADYDKTYSQAYRHGWEGRARHDVKSYAEAEPQLRRDWESSRHADSLAWDRAQLAAQDAWSHIERLMPGVNEKE